MNALLLMIALAADPSPDAENFLNAVMGLPGFRAPQVAAPAPKQETPITAWPERRVKGKMEDYKDLLDNNLFGPPRKKDAPKVDQPKEVVKETPKVHMLSITGFVLNESDNRYEAIVEDREWSEANKKYTVKEIHFYKKGDTMAGGTIAEISFDRLIHLLGDKQSDLKAGDQIAIDGSSFGAAPHHEAVATTSDPKDGPPVSEAAKEEAKKRLKGMFGGKKSAPADTVEEDPQPVKKKRNRD